MIEFIVRRSLSTLVVVFGVVCIVFLFIHLAPGDPVEAMLGESASPADREALRHHLGLDKPLLNQWITYAGGLLRGDLGDSLYRRPVAEMIAERLPATVWLALCALAVALTIAIPLGTLAAVNKGTLADYAAMAVAMLGISIPGFWLGPLLILVFAVWLGWLPVSGREGVLSVVLPAVTLGLALAAILSRMTRAALLEVLNEDHVRAARARGLSERAVILRHALRNASLPIVTIFSLQLGVLLGGAVITETVFSWPGLGSLLIEAIERRDYPVVQGCVLLISVSYVVINTLTDLAYGWIDPRIRVPVAR
jgi:peptide/nickel transport system permease protein